MGGSNGFQSCENRWDHALLSVKCCCLCVTDSHNFEVACLKKKLIWLFGGFLVRYLCDAFWQHCLLGQTKMHGTLLKRLAYNFYVDRF